MTGWSGSIAPFAPKCSRFTCKASVHRCCVTVGRLNGRCYYRLSLFHVRLALGGRGMKGNRMSFRFGIAALAAGVLLPLAAPVLAQRPPLAMLDGLEKGSWELRLRDKDGGVERICLKKDARRLIQLRHPSDQCDRLIVRDDANEVTVQYTCHGNGYGRTRIRHETNQLIQIDSQGIAGGLPFAFDAEARWVGKDCR